MIRIGIELNNVVRNINFQVMKYYKKDIRPDFDETTITSNKTSIIEDLPFLDSKKRNEFVFIDYPYEIFGCARVMERNLSVEINDWLIELADKDKDYDVSFFSLRENDLSIPSSYYFLSKIATRVRTVHFPTTDENIWDLYDIIITTNKDIVANAPQGKTVVLIAKEDNIDAKESADYAYDLLSTAIKENKFIESTKLIEESNTEVFSVSNNIETNNEEDAESTNKTTSILGKIKNWFK